MINQRPRGICFNKNALNIQLNVGPELDHREDIKGAARLKQQSPREPTPPKLRAALTRSTRPLQTLYSTSNNILTTNENLEVPKLQSKNNDCIEEEKAVAKLAPLSLATTTQTSNTVTESLVTSKIPRLSTKFPLFTRPQSFANIKLDQAEKIFTNRHLLFGRDNEYARAVENAVPALEEQPEIDEDDSEDIEDIDKSTANRDAVFMVSEIAKDIYSYMYLLEEAQSVSEGSLQDQKIYTPKVRQRLVNWCIDIHNQLNLLTETLYIAIALIDRYFSKVQVKQQSQVQLVAVAATLIASKYEEIYPPEIADLIHLTQNTYSKREIMRMEITILEQLNFNLGRPVPLAFLRRFSKAAHCDLKTHSIAKYLMELSLCEYDCSHWRPSLLAAAALFISVHLVRNGTPSSSSSSSSATTTTTLVPGLRRALSQSSANRPHTQDRWTKTLVHYSRYSRKELLEPAGILCKIVKNSQKYPQSYYCVKKHSQNLSKWTELKSARVDELIKLADQMAG